MTPGSALRVARNVGAVDSSYPRPAYAWYVVVVLLAAYILAFVDREVIALLAPDIKQDLSISDTQMSFLLGGAFAVFYTCFGKLIAWVADIGNRRLLICGGVAVWSCVTMACGTAMSCPALFAFRVGVGVSEPALSPPALSLLKDCCPPDRIGRAVALLGLSYVALPLMPTPGLAIILLIPGTIGGAGLTAAGTVAIIAIAPSGMRAQIIALF